MLLSARIPRAGALLALFAVSGVVAQQLTDVPNISTATLPTATSAQSSTTSSASSGATGGTSSTASSEATSAGTSGTTAATTSGQTSATGSATTTGSVFSLSGLPTIQGAGIPTLAIPYTADAPFMQKSDLPEGTVFIAVGATLAFLGACVLLWRGMVAWSINRSVKRAAVASLRGPEKANTWGNSSTRTGFYKEYEAGNNMSMDALTSAGKPIRNYRDHDNNSRGSTVLPPSNLFFSPTANAQQRNSAINPDGNHSNTHLPAGYYASPSAAQPAGGAGATIIGGSLAPYARHSSMGTPSPPVSPKLPTSSNSAVTQRSALRSGPRDRHPSASRERYGGQTSSTYRQSSASNLGPGNDHLGGTRAPSAYLDDLFDNHGNVPR